MISFLIGVVIVLTVWGLIAHTSYYLERSKEPSLKDFATYLTSWIGGLTNKRGG